MTVILKGLDPILRKLDHLDNPRVFRKPMDRSLKHLQRRLKQKPIKAAGAFSAMATPGQRRAYWAKVGADPSMHGAGGYQRTGNTARAWTTKISNNGRRGEVGNVKPAAPFVYDEDGQQPFHAASGWPRVDRVAKESEDEIIGYFKSAYDKELAK